MTTYLMQTYQHSSTTSLSKAQRDALTTLVPRPRTLSGEGEQMPCVDAVVQKNRTHTPLAAQP
jgi:hypothetical protein